MWPKTNTIRANSKQLCYFFVYSFESIDTIFHHSCCARLLGDVFREKMRNPEWKHQFDLTFWPIFDAAGRRLIGPPSSGSWWDRIHKKLPPCPAVGATQLYFDETFQGQNQGIDTGSLASMNMGQGYVGRVSDARPVLSRWFVCFWRMIKMPPPPQAWTQIRLRNERCKCIRAGLVFWFVI